MPPSLTTRVYATFSHNPGMYSLGTTRVCTALAPPGYVPVYPRWYIPRWCICSLVVYTQVVYMLPGVYVPVYTIRVYYTLYTLGIPHPVPHGMTELATGTPVPDAQRRGPGLNLEINMKKGGLCAPLDFSSCYGC